MEELVEHRADLGSAENNDSNENGQNKQPAHHTASFFPVHSASFLLDSGNDSAALIPFHELRIVA
jgi:hypothetical protein